MAAQDNPRQLPLIVAVLLPIAILALAAWWLISADPLRLFSNSAPPLESLTFERIVLDDAGIHLKVRATGSEPMVIAQVQVDDAYWIFGQTPPGPMPRLSAAWIDLAYPWREGDAHKVVLVTGVGATFTHEIEVAVPTPKGVAGGIRAQVLLGGFVGVLPVALGLLFFPVLRRLAPPGLRFVLSLTLGMLVFLLVDVFEGALEFARDAAFVFQGPVMVISVAFITALGLMALGRRRGAPPSPLALAGFIALGIGLHNLGEGLAIGAAIAAGAGALGAFLVLGFTIHNVTEGIAIAAPMVRTKPRVVIFVSLAVLAGSPAILGIWLGSQAIAPQWGALALSIGAGAIIQVLYEVGRLVSRDRKSLAENLDRALLAGLFLGLAFMYVTGLAIKV